MVERDAGEALNHIQHKAIIALIEKSTVVEAARSAGLHKANIYKWLQEPNFQVAYRGW